MSVLGNPGAVDWLASITSSIIVLLLTQKLSARGRNVYSWERVDQQGKGDLTAFVPRTLNLDTILPHHLREMPCGLGKSRFTPVVVYSFKTPCVYGIGNVFVAYCEILADA